MAVLPDPGRSRAVLIGASTYSHLDDLPAVRNNLSGFRDVLVATDLGGLPAIQWLVMLDHGLDPADPQLNAELEPTLAALRAATGVEDGATRVLALNPGTAAPW